MYSHFRACVRGTNTLMQIFMLLNLNPVMSIIANVPAAIASTVRIFNHLIPVYSSCLHKFFNRLSLAASSGV